MSSDKVNKKKEKKKLLIDGHYFIKLRELKNSTKWCCDKKGTLMCKSIVKTSLVDGSYDIKYGPTEHNHEDPKNRKLIVATPRKSIIGKSKNRKYAAAKLDFEETSNASENEQVNDENQTNNTDPPQKTASVTKCKLPIPFVDQPIQLDFGVKEIKFVKWGKYAHEKLFIDGNYFTLKGITRSTCDWACRKRPGVIACPVRVITIFSSGAHRLKFPPNVVPHNHETDPINSGENNCPEEKKVEKIAPTESMADVSMHTQLMSRIPQTDLVEFPPPIDSEIEFAILFGLRRQMMPEQIFYELQSVYGLDAPSFGIVSEHCKKFRGGYYPTNDSVFRNRDSDIHSMNLSKFNDDPNVSREVLTVQPDVNTSIVL